MRGMAIITVFKVRQENPYSHRIFVGDQQVALHCKVIQALNPNLSLYDFVTRKLTGARVSQVCELVRVLLDEKSNEWT